MSYWKELLTRMKEQAIFYLYSMYVTVYCVLRSIHNILLFRSGEKSGLDKSNTEQTDTEQSDTEQTDIEQSSWDHDIYQNDIKPITNLKIYSECN